MWKVTIYSEGDLTHDEFLMFEDENILTPGLARFESEDDLYGRIDELRTVIRRANAEIDFLEKQKDQIIGRTTWSTW